MKKYKTIWIGSLWILILSCKAPLSLQGEYSNISYGDVFVIIFNNDSTFSFKRKVGETPYQCNGIFKYLDNYTVEMHCIKRDAIIDGISSGSMGDSVQTVKILSEKRIRLAGVVLKKK
jgi:hypothetical protein